MSEDKGGIPDVPASEGNDIEHGERDTLLPIGSKEPQHDINVDRIPPPINVLDIPEDSDRDHLFLFGDDDTDVPDKKAICNGQITSHSSPTLYNMHKTKSLSHPHLQDFDSSEAVYTNNQTKTKSMDHLNKKPKITVTNEDGKPNGHTISQLTLDSHVKRHIHLQEVAPSSTSFIDDHSWKLSLSLFTSKKRGKQKDDRKLPKSVKDYYKAQDELIEAFEETQLEIDDAMENTDEQQRLRSKAALLAKITFFANLTLFIGKAIAAGLSGSLAIISSVIDSGVDLVSGIIIWWTSRAMKKRDPFLYPQGRTKLEPIAIVVLSVIMALASVQLVKESIEHIITYATTNSAGPVVEIPTIVILVSTIVIKFVLFMMCRRLANPSIQALAQDHRNDVLSNIIALAAGFVGYKWWPFADPIGAILISIYIIGSWIVTGWEQIKLLTGHTARPDLLKKITWICLNHHQKVVEVDTVRAYHFGNNFLAEVDIVLSEFMGLRMAHDIGEALQHKIERLPEVERAFVHLDYESTHSPFSEHKIV